MNHQFFTCVLPLLDNSMQLTFKANCFLKCWYFNNCILNHVTNVITESFTSESFNGKEISGIFNFMYLSKIQEVILVISDLYLVEHVHSPDQKQSRIPVFIF